MKKLPASSSLDNDTVGQTVDYGRLRNNIKGILEQQYRAGDRIPSERSLAAKFKVSPATVSRALQDLSRTGFVRRVRGSGTYLCETNLQQAYPENYSNQQETPLQENDISFLPALSRSSLTVLTGRTIGIVGGIGDTPLPGEPEMAGHRISSAIEREIQAYGGRTRIIDTQRHSKGSERALINDMLREGVDGLTLIDVGPSAARWLLPMLEARQRTGANLPIVRVHMNDICEWPVDCVRIDSAWGVFEATGHLLKQGHSRLAFLSTPAGLFSWADVRVGAFQRAIQLWNISHEKPVSGSVLYGPKEFCSSGMGCQWQRTGQALAEEFIQLPELTGAIAANDAVALQFISTLKTKGLRVPEDVSVIGYDNVVDAARAELSTLDPPVDQLGIQVAKLCRQRLESPIWEMRIELALKPTLLIRASIRSLS